MSEGKIADDGQSVVYNQPDMEGVSCEVQHSIKSGQPFCKDQGMCGIGVVIMPTGQPRLVLQLRHADGTSLTATWLNSHALTVIECITDAVAQAQAISEAADKAKGMAS